MCMKLVPRTRSSGLYDTLTVDTPVAYAIPGTASGRSDDGLRAIGIDLYFVDPNDGTEIEGRVGFSGTNDDDAAGGPLETYADGDDTLGYHRVGKVGFYCLPKGAKFLWAACHIDGALLKGSWLFE